MLAVSINLQKYKFKIVLTCVLTILIFFLQVNFIDIFTLQINNILVCTNFNLLFFQPFYDQDYLWTITLLLTKIMVDNMYLADDPIWIKSLQISLIIDLLWTNFLTYSDCLILINELTTLNSVPGAQYFINDKLLSTLIPENNLNYLKGLKKLNRIIEIYPALNFQEPNKSDFFNIEDEEKINFTEKELLTYIGCKLQYIQEYWEFERASTISIINSIFHKNILNENLKEFYIIFLYNQLTFLNLIISFFRKKIFIFIFINLFLFSFMLWNLYWLATASNLIYSLIHFLLFAILSGLITLFWGSTYIGFCILLIYGAAIPVLALYIIMLVNVDLIQWLFFVEHQENKSFFSLLVRSLLFITVLIIFLITLLDNLILMQEWPEFNVYSILFYFLLAKRYIKFLEISYTNESIYDLTTNFYCSDIDKVASAAFHFSTNELIALVLLLLIAIIVVIGISRGSRKLDEDFYEENFLDLQTFNHFWSEKMLENFSLIKKEQNLTKFLKKKNKWTLIPFYQNSNDLTLYYQTRQSMVTHKTINEKQFLDNTRYFSVTPYDYWYTLYDSEWMVKFLVKNDEFLHPLPYGTQNKHPDDYYFCVLNYGLAE